MTTHPTFSIVVPTYSRPDQLTTCLRAMAHLRYPRDCFEVLVVDDGSPTPLEPVVRRWQGDLDVSLLTQPHAGPATARGTGAARAKGRFLAFTDDDCAPAPDWLDALAARFATTPESLVGGRTLNVLHDNRYATASQLIIDYLYGYYNRDPGQARFFTSNNLAAPADQFHSSGGFDPRFPRAGAEDRDFCDRWLSHGHRMIYAPEALVHHAHSLSGRTFWRQHFNYGRGAFHFHRARARRGGGRVRLEPASFYLGLLGHPLSRAGRRSALLLSGLMAVSQGANAAGFWWEQIRSHRRGRAPAPAPAAKY